jgi:carbamoyltransferase
MSKFSEIANKSERDKFDVAASLQKATEVFVREKIDGFMKLNKQKYLCLSGGVALNSVMVGKMYDWWPHLEEIYVCPVPYDGGLCLGAAQYLWHHVLENERIEWNDNATPYLGKTYTKVEIQNAIDKYKNDERFSDYKVLIHSVANDDYVANLLSINNNVISVFGGGSESGRRALGNRSILADPRSNKMKDIINEKVKHRQWFRPFAPSILKDEVKNWFEKDIESPYMSTVINFKDNMKDKVPAVVHFDGSARLQTVSENNNKWYYNFIKKFFEKTGVPIVLNTSYNDREPIVETPEHAIDCFLRTNIDYLYFYDAKILIEKVR